MKKRLIAMLLSLSMVGLLLAGCGGNNDKPAADPKPADPAPSAPADPAPAAPSAPAGDIDYKNFTINPSQIPQRSEERRVGKECRG